MKRTAPSSPRLDRAMLDQALDAIPTPTVPTDLAARILRDVPRMAQLPPLAEASVGEAAPSITPAPAISSAPATIVALTGHHPARRLPAWLTIGTGGFGALAAGLAALALLGPGQQQDTVVATAPSPAPILAAAPTEATPPVKALATPAAVKLATTHRTVPDAKAPAAPGQTADTPALPQTEAAPPVSELAIATPPRPEAGPQSPDASVPPSLGSRGQMGPVLPQGYGYSGGGIGPSVPSGAPVRMSGGPGPGQGGPPPP